MIVNGGSRSNGAFFARHLMRVDDNERVTVAEMRGFAYAQDVPEAFAELRDRAQGTRCKNFFYHANINTRADELLTPEQWQQAADRLEHSLHLDGQPRFIVEHEKEGRIHRHIVWSRIDADSMTAISDSYNYRTHELTASELEEAFGHEATARALTRDKETTPRPDPNVADWESFRAADSKIDLKAMKAELTELWQHSDSGSAFAAAIEERGYILAKGDRRDFCVIDAAGDEHSLARRIDGAKAAEIRSRMADVDRDALPSVAEARTQARSRPEEEPTGEPADTHQAQPESAATAIAEAPAPSVAAAAQAAAVEAELSPFAAIMRERIEEERAAAAPAVAALAPVRTVPSDAEAINVWAKEAEERPAFDQVMRETVREACTHLMTEPADNGGRWAMFAPWLAVMREHVAGFGQSVRDYWNDHFGGHRHEPEEALSAETPENTVSGPGSHAEPMQQQPQQPQPGPELG